MTEHPDDIDDATERSPRRRSTALPLNDSTDDLEQTERSPRRRSSVLPVDDADSASLPSAASELDDTTERSPRRRSTAITPELDDTTELSPRRRSTAVPAQEATPDAQAELDDSTRILGVRRSSVEDTTQLVRPRDLPSPPAAPITPPPPLASAAEQTYGIRRAEPVFVERTAPAARAPQPLVDTAAVQGESRRRGRRRTVIVVVAASALVVVAAAALLVVIFSF